MTNPTIATINPSKAKTWWAAIGGILATLVTIAPQIAGVLPPPWGPLLTGVVGVIALITGSGVYQAPYKPEGTSVVSNADLKEVATPTPPVDPPPGGYENPWR